MKIAFDNEEMKIKQDKKALYEVTKFDLIGSTLEIEGYATIENLQTEQELRIRKSILLLSEEMFLENDEANVETNEEVIEKKKGLKPLIIPLENCRLSELDINPKQVNMQNYEQSLVGFKGKIDLSNIHNKCLPSGNYFAYIKLEQIPEETDEFKYEKILPIWNVKKNIKQKHYATKMVNETPNEISKYSLVIGFDDYNKTIVLKNTLVQRYNPKSFAKYQRKEKTNQKIEILKRRFFKLMYILFCFLPINKKKIIFASDSRDELNGNLYFIYEELQKRDLKLTYKFLLNKTIEQKKTMFKLMNMAYQFATAKVILIDDFYPLIYPLKIRKNADLIQTWHAAGAFKTFGFSRLGRPGGPPVWSWNHRNYTKVAVSSEDVRKHYAEGFGVDIEKVYATGVPRSDVFFDEEYKLYVKETFYKSYPQLKGKKVILFAPTFRGNGQSNAYYPFNKLDLKTIYEKLNKEYVFLFKIHPFVNNKLNIPKEYRSFYYDFSHIREINDLLLVTDHLITDYSSVCFEYALLQKPISFFAFDVEDYIAKRDFYYNYYDFIPGPLVKNTEELLDVIEKDDFDKDKLNQFVQTFFHKDFGNASKKVVDELVIESLNRWNKKVKKESSKFTIPKSRKELFVKSIHHK